MRKYKHPAVKIAVIYFIIGSLWIIFSDQFVDSILPSKGELLGVNILKGLAFVIITSVILYLLINRYLKRIEAESLDKKVKEEELSRSENLFYNVTNASPVAIVILDPQGQISYANSFAENLLQLSKSKTGSYNFQDWEISSIDSEAFSFNQLPFMQVIKTKKSVYNVKHAINFGNNSKVFLSINATPLFDKANELIGVINVMQDITSTIKMEEELRASENKYRILFEDNPEPMWLYDIETYRYIDVNNAAINKYGYSKDEFLSMTIKDIRPIEDLHKLEEYLNEINEGMSASITPKVWRHILKSGELIYVRMISNKIEINGKVCRIVLATDVTSEIEKEKALKESEKKYRRIFENIIDVYFETTIDGQILEVSPSIEIMSMGQYSREELVGTQITSLYEDDSERIKYIKQLIKHGRVDDYEISLRNKDGITINCSLTAKLIGGEDSQRIVGSMRDVTVRIKYEEDLIKAKEAAESASKLKTEFLAQMSHEIRTPLNIILSASDLIKSELNSEQIENLADVFKIEKSSGKRIIRTIDSILNMSELQIGSYEPDFQDLNLRDEILLLVDEYRIIANEKNLKLEIKCELENPKIKADRYSVSQIFANLIDNAIKYTDKGKIEIIISGSREGISVDVKDTGRGIQKDFIPHIFETFTQEQQGYSRMFEGSGLGLALVDKFCKINNAKISVDTEPDIGSTFIVDFPR